MKFRLKWFQPSLILNFFCLWFIIINQKWRKFKIKLGWSHFNLNFISTYNRYTAQIWSKSYRYTLTYMTTMTTTTTTMEVNFAVWQENAEMADHPRYFSSNCALLSMYWIIQLSFLIALKLPWCCLIGNITHTFVLK